MTQQVGDVAQHDNNEPHEQDDNKRESVTHFPNLSKYAMATSSVKSAPREYRIAWPGSFARIGVQGSCISS